MRKISLLALIAWICLGSLCFSQTPKKKKGWSYPPNMPNAEVEVYKRVNGEDLNAYIFFPENHQPENPTGAILFFFGGGWTGGTPEQFAAHCEYFSKRGLVAIACDYRVAMRQSVKPVCCVADAKSAVRWARENADRLGVNADQIVAAGGSAGGHIAACTGTINGVDEEVENLKISSRPNAMALFNPVIATRPIDDRELDEEDLYKRTDRLGIAPEKISPFHNVVENLPPTIIFHGAKDEVVPIKQVVEFEKRMQKAGNRCELHTYEGQIHGFFNQGRNQDKFFKQTVNSLDQFLVSLEYLKPLPTKDEAP